uniref:chloroplast protein-transporting ATPase n=1 Tax=Daucus carota subsp. sativus TaxID=79200 RepID=A0A161ZQ99_DAUCS
MSSLTSLYSATSVSAYIQSHNHTKFTYNNAKITFRARPIFSISTRTLRCSISVASKKGDSRGDAKGLTHIASSNYWVVKDYNRLVNSVNSLEQAIQQLSDDQLAAKTVEFRNRLAQGELLADIQPEAFAVVREAARRKVGMRHFDVQIIGGAVLHDGSIAEMKTGEGKTLVSTLAAYLNALTGQGVHVVTVNDYLAQRDAEWMGRIHRSLGLSVGLIQELGFDYLRDNLAGSNGQLVMRWPKPFHFAIVDEVDSVLIDEGRNPLLISGEASMDAARYPVAAKVAELLTLGLHYNVELKDNSVELTEEGIALSEMALETNDLWDENDPWARFVMNALKAKEFYRRDVQYMVKDGKALIINELTGRVEEKRRWSEGIHQAVEAKEGLRVQADSVVVAQITYQSLFKLYPKLSGMTGTAKTEEKEFLKMFQVPVIEVPTNLPNIRNDLPIQAFANARGKWAYVCEEIVSMFRLGRPVLVGTTSALAIYISTMLDYQLSLDVKDFGIRRLWQPSLNTSSSLNTFHHLISIRQRNKGAHMIGNLFVHLSAVEIGGVGRKMLVDGGGKGELRPFHFNGGFTFILPQASAALSHGRTARTSRRSLVPPSLCPAATSSATPASSRRHTTANPPF